MSTEPTPIVLSRDCLQVDVARQIKAGSLQRIRRGAYAVISSDESLLAHCHQTTLAHIRAVDEQLVATHVFSHASAALLWGLQLWEAPEVTHVRQAARASSRHARDIARHIGLPEQHVLLDGIPTTTLAQTVIDCLLTMPPLAGLCVADSALKRGLTCEDALADLTSRGSCNGVRRAATVLSLADGGADNCWETWLRYFCLRLGLPKPVTQFRVNTFAGLFYVDLAWPEHKVLLEFDGKVKYADGAFDARYRGVEALVREKRREDAIVETLKVRPLRVMASHANNPVTLARRILDSFPAHIRKTARIRPDLPLPRRTGRQFYVDSAVQSAEST